MTAQDIMMVAAGGGILILLLIVMFVLKAVRSRKLDSRLSKLQDRNRISNNGVERKVMTDSLKKSSADSSIKLLDFLLKRLPNLNKLRYRLVMSACKMDVGHYFMVSFGLVLLVALIINLLTKLPMIMAILVGVIIGLSLPHMYVSIKLKKRLVRFVSVFPEAIELIVRGIRSGLPVQESFKVIAEEVSEPVKDEFAIIANSIKLGMPVDDALREASKRLRLLEFDFFVTSLNLQRETGGNLAEILGNLARTIRERQMMKLKIKAMSSEARASAWIVGSLPFLVGIALFFMSPDYANLLFDDIRGNFALLAATGSVFTGVMIMKKMGNFEI
jgi:tight adherence protein B